MELQNNKVGFGLAGARDIIVRCRTADHYFDCGASCVLSECDLDYYINLCRNEKSEGNRLSLIMVGEFFGLV